MPVCPHEVMPDLEDQGDAYCELNFTIYVTEHIS